jgi:lysophospholipase L1-like esterase
MFKPLLSAMVCCLLLSSALGQKKYVISVIGSSTAAGMGASPIDSSWVNLTKAYFQKLGILDTIYNLAVGGTTTYAGMPTGYIPPSSRSAPLTANNITAALSYNPDVVIIAYASNDAADGFSLAESMSNLRTMYQTVIDAGKIAYVTTSQPRNNSSFTLADQEKQFMERDSVLSEFRLYSLNFYNRVVSADSLTMNPIYNFGDTIHLNDAGHQQLFQVLKDSNILASISLALTLGRFTAISQQQDVLVQWTSESAGAATFVVQRSQDGTTFTNQDEVDAPDNTAGSSYSWQDQQPLTGTSYYRLKAVNDGDTTWSTIATVKRALAGLAIGNIYVGQGGSQLVIGIQSPSDQNVDLSIVNAAGALVTRQVVYVAAPSSTVNLSVSGLAAGVYFLRMASAEGTVITKSFMKP